MTEIRLRESDSKGAFYVEEEGKMLAQMTFSKAGKQRIIIDHTEVSEALRGKNVGLKLVEAAVNYAREHQIKILPLCPFANSIFKRKSAFQDVLS